MTDPLAPVENIDQIAKEISLRAESFVVIKDETDYVNATKMIRESKDQLKKFVEFMDPIRKSQRDALNVTLVKIKSVSDVFNAVIDRLTPACIAFQEAQKKERDIAVAKANGSLSMAEQEAAPIVHSDPGAPGLSIRATWSAEVTDLMELVKAVAKGKQPLSYLSPCLTALNLQAKSLKSELKIPGVKAIESKGYSRRD